MGSMKNIVKAGATLFVVGALLAVAAPAIAVGLGMASNYAAGAVLLGHSASPLWMGAFFGAFGAIDAAVRPMMDKWFGGGEAAAPAAQRDGVSPKKTLHLTIVNAVAKPACCPSHTEALAARREAEQQADKQLG
ncbi:MAG: hypothetical protein EBV03_04705 [Proteobacteria bacterium]|nr:hypothetical protein [Pseudomonadota bacterium]